MQEFDAFRPDGLDMSRPPTRAEAHAIGVYLSAEQGYYTGIQTPLTRAEELWLEVYIGYRLPASIEITQIQVVEVVEGERPESARAYALALSYLHPELGPLSLSVASLADFWRLQRWGFADAAFAAGSRLFTPEQKAEEWERVLLFRNMVISAATVVFRKRES